MKETVIVAAIRMPGGYVVHGHRHMDAMMAAARIPRYTETDVDKAEQGFVTSQGRFVDRREAHQIHYADEPSIRHPDGQLYSEELY